MSAFVLLLAGWLLLRGLARGGLGLWVGLAVALAAAGSAGGTGSEWAGAALLGGCVFVAVRVAQSYGRELLARRGVSIVRQRLRGRPVARR